MHIEEFEEKLKGLVSQWKDSYKENNGKNPQDWPIDFEFYRFYEDFRVWMELTGENL